jgi:trehalose 6-phosphate synthase/phosphatase
MHSGSPSEPRLLLVSNRLPVTLRRREGAWRAVPSMGGLAAGLRALHARGGGLWFGWPGDGGQVDPGSRAQIDRDLLARGLVPVELVPADVDGYYNGFSNGVLWPLFHYLLDRIPRDAHDWACYERVNRRFAETVAAKARPGDLVWVHDYHLALVPKYLRELAPRVSIGFFLHVPFPSSEVFRLLPWREAWLTGVLGSDLIGFHTLGYLRHFAASLLRVLGVEAELDRLRVEGREIRLGVYPMGCDAKAFDRAARSAVAERKRVELRSGAARSILLGVDRLDYTKGIPRRLLAFELLLERRPDLHGAVQLVQIAVPSRDEVPTYERYKREVDAIVGGINGRFGTPEWTPIRYVHRGFSQPELAAYYRASDVMLVTPLRDGLNLVAKEFVAGRPDGDGVLVLSEFAGAAAEMIEAVPVNPYDIAGMAERIAAALDMPEAERRRRMAALRRRVFDRDVHAWAGAFVRDLEATAAQEPPRRIAEAVERARDAERLVLLLDYDGTLVPFAARPEEATPDPELVELLSVLGARPGTAVHVVSGRTRAFMDRCLGALPVHLHAEHGSWTRPAGFAWIRRGVDGSAWLGRIASMVDEFVRNTPGAFVERKEGGLSCHYRAAEREAATLHARELRLHLLELLSNAPVQVIAGSFVVEVRTHGCTKGDAARWALAQGGVGAVVLAVGDDATDEDLFAALPPGALTVHVGPGPTRAAWNLEDWRAARAVLQELARAAPRAR